MTRPVRLAVAQFQPRKGSYPANIERIRGIFGQLAALDPVPDLVCFPESALSGYFVEGGIEEVAVTTGTLARDLDTAWRSVARGGTMDIAVGFYERWQHNHYNSAAYVRLGETEGGAVVHVHRKLFLPTYGLFDEHRFVEPGGELGTFQTPWGRAALLVCEDAWHSMTGTIAALDGAQVIITTSAAPARGLQPGIAAGTPTSVSRWERLIRDIAEEHGVFAVLASLVGSEGGKAFQGGSLVVGPHGDVRARGPVLDEAVIVADLDFDDLARARADAPLLADLKAQLPVLQRELARVQQGHPAPPPVYDAARPSPAPPTPDRPPSTNPHRSSASNGAIPIIAAAHSAPPSLELDPVLTERWLVTFIRDELARRGFADAVVGLSGGVDSAVTAALAVRALGPTHVHAVALPYRTSNPESLAHARLVADALGCDLRTLDISAAVDGYLAHEPDADSTRRGNVMARVRMIALFDLSAKLKALPLGTGNKTERLLGYFTWHADDSPPVNPIGDLYKTQVWELARHLGIPREVVAKAPTADLVAGQTDEADIGVSYPVADGVLNWLLHGWTASEIAARGYAPREIEVVARRLGSTHWKRRPPTAAMVSGTAIGQGYLRPVDY